MSKFFVKKIILFLLCFILTQIIFSEIAFSKSTILIMQLRPIGINEEVSKKLSEYLNNAFVDINSSSKAPFEVSVTNADLIKILEQMSFEKRFTYDEAINLGKQKGAEYVLIGSIGKLYGKYVITVRIVNVSNGIVEWSDVKRLDISTDDNGLINKQVEYKGENIRLLEKISKEIAIEARKKFSNRK
jgi:TolB-like protein